MWTSGLQPMSLFSLDFRAAASDHGRTRHRRGRLMDTIDPKEIRYIKLGAGGKWVQVSLSYNRILCTALK